jgi:NAD+ synthase
VAQRSADRLAARSFPRGSPGQTVDRRQADGADVRDGPHDLAAQHLELGSPTLVYRLLDMDPRMRKVPVCSSLLRIDEARAVQELGGYLRSGRAERTATAALLGLSGGIDSAVLATIAVGALGAPCVRAAYLYDQHSAPGLRKNARMVAAWLGLELEETSIEPPMRQAGVYSSYAMRLTSFAAVLNRLLHEAYRVAVGEPPFVSSLRLGGAETTVDNTRDRGFLTVIRQLEAAFNARHIYRRQALETEAAARNCLLLGAANRTEWLTGWFVRGGVDDLPNQPLRGLYKTQVRQLAAFLKLPAEVLSAIPSPDMMRGITDELALGMAYSNIDLALDFLEDGLTAQEAFEAGVTQEQIRRVQEMKRLSAWKRSSSQLPPPVDGGPLGGSRLSRKGWPA